MFGFFNCSLGTKLFLAKEKVRGAIVYDGGAMLADLLGGSEESKKTEETKIESVKQEVQAEVKKEVNETVKVKQEVQAEVKQETKSETEKQEKVTESKKTEETKIKSVKQEAQAEVKDDKVEKVEAEIVTELPVVIKDEKPHQTSKEVIDVESKEVKNEKITQPFDKVQKQVQETKSEAEVKQEEKLMRGVIYAPDFTSYSNVTIPSEYEIPKEESKSKMEEQQTVIEALKKDHEQKMKLKEVKQEDLDKALNSAKKNK